MEPSPPKKKDRLLPPGEWVSIDMSPVEEEHILEVACKDLPIWFHFENVNGTIRPRSVEDKKKLLNFLGKL